AALEDSCGFMDAQPAQRAAFSVPKGVAIEEDTTLGMGSFLFVADSGNNRIRAMSAVCTFACENGGLCTGADTCTCQEGWDGVDCTTPLCEGACASNQLCVAPKTCACKPGFDGPECEKPQCVQDCGGRGECIAPDTCGCHDGW